jgi:hypothetical protein
MNALAEITGAVVDGTFAPRRAITVCEVCQTMLRAAHKQRATSRAKLTYDLAPLIERHGDEPVQRLTKAHIDQLMDKATSAAVGCHRSQQVRQTAAMVLADAKRQGLVFRNVAEHVDPVAVGHRGSTPTPRPLVRLEPMTGIEPAYSAWEVDSLRPLVFWEVY